MIKYPSELCLQGLPSLGGKCLGNSILASTSSHKEKNNEKHTRYSPPPHPPTKLPRGGKINCYTGRFSFCPANILRLSDRCPATLFNCQILGWSGGAKVLCILHHRGVQLILAYSWARPAILVVGKGRGGMFLFLLFLHFYSCSSFFPVPLFHLLYSLFYLFSPFLWETTQNDPQGLTCR